MSYDEVNQQCPQSNQEVIASFPFIDAGFGLETQAAAVETDRAKLRLAEAAERGEKAIEITRREPDLVKRAKSLNALQAFSFPEIRKVRDGDQFITQAKNTDSNRIAIFKTLFGEERPHVDTFRGRLVDHRGVIVDDRYPMVDMLDSLAAAGLKEQSIEQVRRTYKEWALLVQRNSQIELMNQIVPAWDGVPRMQTKLIELFEPFDTELTRKFGKYFWLSLYCRIMYPGCLAPMVLSLIGGQNSGKSFFSKMLCRVLMDDPEADSVQWDLSGDQLDRLREITGSAVVGNIGEFSGFSRGDMQKINDLITRTSDRMHYKFEGQFQQLRQWVFCADGNKYTLQRDETGNRRFYPLFVGQLPDADGQPQWKEVFSADFTHFKDDVLQIMAECRMWLEHNGDVKGYEEFASSLSKEVYAFNKSERSMDRGTIADPNLDQYFMSVIRDCPKKRYVERKGDQRNGVVIRCGDFGEVYARQTRGERVNWNRAKLRMGSISGEEKRLPGKIPGFFFPGYEDEAAFNAYLDSLESEEGRIIEEPVRDLSKSDRGYLGGF